MKYRRIISKIIIFSFFITNYHLNSYGRILCGGYESLNLWPETIYESAKIQVEVCCEKDNEVYDTSQFKETKALQIKLGINDIIEIKNLDRDTKPIEYSCSKDSPIYKDCKIFLGGYINIPILNGRPQPLKGGMPVRIYHEYTDNLTQTGGKPAYYGFRVVKGKVEIRGAENSEKICEAKKRGDTRDAVYEASKIRRASTIDNQKIVEVEDGAGST